MNTNPHNTKSRLGHAYLRHRARVMAEVQPKIMGHVELAVLDGIESFATDDPDGSVARMHEEMLQAIGLDVPAGNLGAVARFSGLYRDASELVFPATTAFLTVCDDLGEYSSSYSLSSIDLDTLRAVDLEAHSNPILDRFRIDLKSRLEKVSGIDDVTAYSQAFEIYGEIIAYRFLHERVPTDRIPECEGVQTPDFRCRPKDGKPFRVEVKTFDIAGGDARKLDMLDDGLDAKAELEEQIHAGKPVASAITEIAPFRKAGETKTYDPRSLIRVIDTLREKSKQSFKAGQFAEGPTIALAITDRLPLPGGKFGLAPYYYADYIDGGIASGVLWHMAYGRRGTPIFRLPEFAGADSLDGYLDKDGLFVDESHPFAGPGLIALHREQGEWCAYGLVNRAYPEDNNWSIDDTHDALSLLCHCWNDEKASRSWNLSADIGTQS